MARLRSKPRISVNKLAEYIEANPTRRKQIVIDAKYPQDFITARYKEVRESIKSFLINDRDEDIALAAIEDLKLKKVKTDFQEQDRNLSIESMEAILEIDLSELDGLNLSNHDDENKLIDIMGLDISVNPDIIITSNKGKIIQKGALKAHLSKTNQLSEEGQSLVAVLVHEYVSKFLLKKGEISSQKLCFSLDIFSETMLCCPKAYKLRLKRVEAACEEIVLWWATL